jgi:hypothetical protein
LLCVVFFVLAASRRWEQLTTPQVWCEDAWVVGGFINGGWREVLLPLNGYLVLVPKLITGVSLAFSIYYYPLISAVIALVFTIGVGLAVALAPTRLSGKFLCAISIFVIPSDPEVFGLPLYTLWWSAILLIICALWDERVPARFFRSALVIVGGLSSPFVFVALPVFYFRALWYRSLREERTIAIVATVVAAIQVPFVLLGATKAIPPVSALWQNVIPKFCGWFVLGNLTRSAWLLWPAGLSLLALAAIFVIWRRRDPSAWILVVLYIGAISSSVARVDPTLLNPSGAGPRYFFLPFVLTFWILVQLCLTAKTKWVRLPVAIIALVSLLNAIPVWARHHTDMRWAENLRSSRLFPAYWIKAQYDGSPNSGFFTVVPGALWNARLQRDWFVSQSSLQNLPTFAFRVVDPNESDEDKSPSISSSSIRVGGHEAFLRLKSGERVRFRSGKVATCQNMEVIGREGEFIATLPITTDWVTLEFSNSRLPREFTLKVVDQGQGMGEWSPTDNSF